MLWKALHKLGFWLSMVGIAIIAAGTIVAGVLGGWQVAGMVGFILFLLLDGLECLRTVVTHSDMERRHEEDNDRERARFIEKTKDNPTIR